MDRHHETDHEEPSFALPLPGIAGMQSISGLMLFDNRPEESGRATGAVRPTITRNDPCLCGSGRKYRKCCRPKLEKKG